MKKQELIHTHSLLAQIQTHCEEETNLAIENPNYSKNGVKPTSIHKSKTDHKESILLLADEIADDMEEEMEKAKTTA